MIQKLLSIAMLPLLLASSHLQLTEEDIQNNRDYFEVIDAATGKKEERTLYADKPVIQTHIMAVSAIKKALADEGIDPSHVRVLLYYNPIAIADDVPPRIWNSKSHPNTISSPWLDITKSVTTSGETRVTIRIDGTAARLLRDLYSESEDKSNEGSFLSIPTIKENCFRKIIIEYQKAASETLGLDTKWVANQTRKNYSCVAKKLREPLLSLFQSSKQEISHMSMIFGLFDRNVHDQLFLYCQDAAKEYYSELYSHLAVQGLQILESESNSELNWWTNVVDQIKSIQECQS